MKNPGALRASEQALWGSVGLEPIEHTFRLASLDVKVRVQEVGMGEPVLFLHGGSSWGTSWANLVASLTDFRCLLVDRPGTGLSEPIDPPIGTVGDLARVADELVPDVLDGLGLVAAHVVCTSLGGWFALRSALSAPSRFLRTVVVGWTGGAPVARLPLSLRVGNLPLVGEVMGRLPVGPTAVKSIFRSLGEGTALADGRISTEAIAAFAALLNHTDTLAADLALSRLFLTARGLRGESILIDEADRRAIRGPLTFLWGTADPFGGPDIAQTFVEPFPDARLEILEGAGHVPWFDEPQLVPHLVREALTN
jgi:pimeloyl-ACP methyl ester carboxylesterase